MPHFIIDCSEDILASKTHEEIMQTVFDTAESTGLFASGDIKVRINSYKHYMVGKTRDSFIHIFGNIMEGRTDEMKKDLSTKMVAALNEMFPSCPIVSMNVRNFEKASYCNKSMI